MQFCLLVLLLLALICAPARASTCVLTYACGDYTGTISCVAPISNVSGVVLQDGVLVIQGVNIAVRTSVDANNTYDVLVGKVVRSEVVPDSNNGQVTVLAVFTGGTLIRQFDDPCQEELVFRNNGALTGRIADVNDSSLSVIFKDKTINNISFASVLYVRSPRAFVFNIALCQPGSTKSGDSFKANIEGVLVKPTTAKRVVEVSSVAPKAIDSDSEFDFESDNTYLQPRWLYPGFHPDDEGVK